MAQEKTVKLTKEQTSDLLASVGISAKRLEQMGFELESTCTEGIFTSEIETAEYSGNKYGKIVCVNEDGEKVGTVAIGRLFDSHIVMEDDKPATRKLGENFKNKEEYAKSAPNRKAENFGKYMLKTQKVNDLSKYGKSELEQLGSLFGKHFTMTKVTFNVVKEFPTATTTAAANPLINSNIAKVQENFAAKELCVFTIH